MEGLGAIRAGQAYVQIGVRNTVDAGLKQIKAKLEAFGNVVSNIGTKLIGLGTAVTTAFGTATGLFMVTGSHLSRIADRIGISVSALTELHYAAQMTGVETQLLNTALAKMGMRISEAARGSGEATNALRELGLSAAMLQRLPVEQQLRVIADALMRVRSNTDRLRLATKFFEEEGMALVNMLEGGSAGLDKYAAAAASLGLVWSDADAKKAEALAGAWKTLKAQLVMIGMHVGSALTPVLLELADALSPLIKRLADFIQNNKELVVTAAKWAVSFVAVGVSLRAALFVTRGYGAVFGMLVAGGRTLIGMLFGVSGAFSAIAGVAGSTAKNLLMSWVYVFSALTRFFGVGGATDVIYNFFGGLLGRIAPMFATAGRAVGSFVSTMATMSFSLDKVFARIFAGFSVQKISRGLRDTVALFVYMFKHPMQVLYSLPRLAGFAFGRIERLGILAFGGLARLAGYAFGTIEGWMMRLGTLLPKLAKPLLGLGGLLVKVLAWVATPLTALLTPLAAIAVMAGVVGVVWMALPRVFKGIKTGAAGLWEYLKSFATWMRDTAVRLFGSAFATLKAGFAEILESGRTALDGIVNAVKAGDLDLAWKITTTGLELIWKQTLQTMTNAFAEFRINLMKDLWDLWGSIQDLRDYLSQPLAEIIAAGMGVDADTARDSIEATFGENRERRQSEAAAFWREWEAEMRRGMDADNAEIQDLQDQLKALAEKAALDAGRSEDDKYADEKSAKHSPLPSMPRYVPSTDLPAALTKGSAEAAQQVEKNRREQAAWESKMLGETKKLGDALRRIEAKPGVGVM